MRIGLTVVGLILVAATALPLVRTEKWWIRSLDFPRLQIAVLLALVLAGFLFFYNPSRILDNTLLVALTVSLGYQAYQVLPYTRLSALQAVKARSSDTSSSVRLLIANVLMDNCQAGQFIALVERHRPDIVLAVETNAWWDQQLSTLEQTFPFALKCPLENTYGMHLFSKLELESPEVRFLIKDGVPSVRTAVRLRSGDWIMLYGIHPHPPEPQQDTEQRDAEILLVGKEVADVGEPAIIAGDLNDVAWSHITRLFQRISGTLDPRVGRGMFPTFHAKYPLLRWPLDHVFHTREFALRELRRLDCFGSDHFPVLVELSFEPEAASQQNAPMAQQEDQEEAAEKIQEGRPGSSRPRAMYLRMVLGSRPVRRAMAEMDNP